MFTDMLVSPVKPLEYAIRQHPAGKLQSHATECLLVKSSPEEDEYI